MALASGGTTKVPSGAAVLSATAHATVAPTATRRAGVVVVAAPALAPTGESLTLLDGIYVTDPALCDRLPTADSFRDVRVLSDGAADMGVGEFCTFGAPSEADRGVLTFAAHCPFSEPEYVATWSWRPTSDRSFVEERGLFPDSPKTPWGLAFSRCDEPREAGRSTASAILDSPDLFNIFEAIMAGHCAGKQVCSVDGVDGAYALRALEPEELDPYQAVSVFQMIYEQGVPTGLPASPDVVGRAINDSRFMIRRAGCTAAECATAVMIVDASVLGSPPGASGEMGFALEMPAGWGP